jgi:hypothetical protein
MFLHNGVGECLDHVHLSDLPVTKYHQLNSLSDIN